MSELSAFLQEQGLDIHSEISDQCEVIQFQVRAKPGAKVEKIQVGSGGTLEVFLQARPVDGAANKALIKSVAKAFGTNTSHVELVRGQKSKLKVLAVTFSFSQRELIYYLDKLKRALNL